MAGEYRPTMVIIPANASATWKFELESWERAGLLEARYWLAEQK
jgi:hypothetical protein